MALHYIGVGIAVLAALGIIYIGLSYLIKPEAIAKTFGLPEAAWPTGPTTAWPVLKGGYDIVFGLIVFALLFFATAHALGIYVLVVSLAPIGDSLTVLRYRGSTAMALGVHAATAAVMILGAIFLLVS